MSFAKSLEAVNLIIVCKVLVGKYSPFVFLTRAKLNFGRSPATTRYLGLLPYYQFLLLVEPKVCKVFNCLKTRNNLKSVISSFYF